MKQDGIISETSYIVPIIVYTTNGEIPLPFVTKKYVDNFMYDKLQMILEFTSNTGNDLRMDCVLEVAAGMTITVFFKSSNTRTSSAGTGPISLPPIGEYYAYIEASTPNNGEGKFETVTYTNHTNIVKIKFWYHRGGINMCRFRLHYQTSHDQWIDKVTLPAGQQSNSWELMEETFIEYCEGIRFNFDEILG